MRDIEIEMIVPCRDRPHRLPRITVGSVEPALQRLDWLKLTRAADQAVLEQAERLLIAIGGAVDAR